MLSEASLTADRLPVVLVPDAEPLVDPDPAEVAERIGLQTDEELAYYDLVVVGAGPAGLAAAVYGASEGLRTVVVERQSFGGQAGMSSRIENYLGFPAGLSGADLARRATTQARRFGCELLTAQEAVGIDVVGSTRVVRLADGSSIASHTVLLAPGVSYRRLDAVGADRLTGRGIWYGTASTGDAALLNGQEAFVVGGANSAGQAALHLARATNVTILYRGDSLQKSMSQYLVERIESMPDEITVLLNAEVREAHGEDQLEEITIDEAGDAVAHSRHGDVRLRRRRAAHRLARQRAGALGSRVHPHGRAGAERAQGLPALAGEEPGAARARDEHPRRLRGRRRPRPVDQARRLRGGRGLDGRSARPPVPQGL